MTTSLEMALACRGKSLLLNIVSLIGLEIFVVVSRVMLADVLLKILVGELILVASPSRLVAVLVATSIVVMVVRLAVLAAHAFGVVVHSGSTALVNVK